MTCSRSQLNGCVVKMGRLAAPTKTSQRKKTTNKSTAKAASEHKEPPTTSPPLPSSSIVPPPRTTLSSLVSSLSPLLSSPAAFLAPSKALQQSLLSHTKRLYDATYASTSRSLPPAALLSALPALLLEPFTVEQVYEQLQLLHRPLLVKLSHDIAQLERASGHPATAGAPEHEEQKEIAVEDDEKDAGETDELDDDDAEMEARLDALADDDDDDDEDQGEEDDEEEEDGDEDGVALDGEEGEGQADDAPPPRPTVRKAASQPRAVSEDAFFSLDAMERFADHFEHAQPKTPTPAKRLQRRRRDEDDEDEDAEDEEDGKDREEDEEEGEDDEFGGEVDLDADVGDVQMEKGERYDDFFDPPTAEDLQGQSLSAMHDQEDDEDGGDGGADDDGEGEQGEGEEDGERAQAEDEFGGHFARLASHQRRINAQPAAPPAATSTAGPQSSFQRQQAALAPTIASIEAQLINPRPWYHRGEVTAAQRPSDSLLTQDLQVDYATKEKEVMTREVNERIEDLIRRRVAVSQYDDPVRATAPKKAYKVRDDVDVSAERSTKSLSTLYEEEYLAAKAAEDSAEGKEAKRSKKEQARDVQVQEVRALAASLFASLAALSNYHYVPAERTEMRVVRAAGEADLLMREEVGIDFEQGGGVEARAAREVERARKEREMVGEAEKDSAERQRRRRRAKGAGKKRKRAEAAEEKANPSSTKTNRVGGRAAISRKEVDGATRARNVKEGVAEGGRQGGKGVHYAKSADFFQQLQKHVQHSEADARKEGML